MSSLHLCSHIVAAAEVNGDLEIFLKQYCGKFGKQRPNLTEIAKHGMPAGVSRKGGKVPKKKISRRARTEENRVPLDLATSGASSSLTTRSDISTVNPSYDYDYSGVHWQSPGSTSLMYPYQSPHHFTNTNWYSNDNPSHPFSMWNWPTTPPRSYASPMPSYTPQQTHHNEMFMVCFKFGNVSVCNGCRKSFSETNEVVIQHPEFRQFTSPRTGLQQSKYGNAYYHAKISCIQLKFPQFQPARQLSIAENIEDKLNAAQKQSLYEEFMIII